MSGGFVVTNVVRTSIPELLWPRSTTKGKQGSRIVRLGVQRVEDLHHPRGYRELRSPAEMRKLLNRKIIEQDRKCAICHEEFSDYGDIVPDHPNPKGIGGAWRDDHPDNIQATHFWCNEEKRSTRMDRRTADHPFVFEPTYQYML